jgi:hypothetical protein
VKQLGAARNQPVCPDESQRPQLGLAGLIAQTRAKPLSDEEFKQAMLRAVETIHHRKGRR